MYAFHDSPEARIARAELIATFDDLDSADTATLLEVMHDCAADNEDIDPEICVPCRAAQILSDQAEAANAPADEEEGYEQPPLTLDGTVMIPAVVPPYTPPSPVEQFRAKVDELSLLLAEVLEGPPIPPRDVSLEELSALLIGAKKWVQMLDGTGIELSDNQKTMRDTVEAVVRKVQGA